MTGLVTQGLGVTLGGRPIVTDVSLAVPAGTLLGLVGPNGAGKTTLLRALAGLTAMTGTARFDGVDLATLAPAARARLLAYLPQRGEIAWDLTVRDVVGLGRLPFADRFGTLSHADHKAVDRAINRLALGALADRPVASLSGGERARVSLARIVATGARLILADEPNAALDPGQALDGLSVLRALSGEGATVVAVLHDLTLAARFCDRVAVVAGGQLVAEGEPADALSAGRIREVFGVESVVLTVDGRAVPVVIGRGG